MRNNFNYLTKAIIGSAFGALVLAGLVVAGVETTPAYYSNGSYIRSVTTDLATDPNEALKTAVKNGYTQGHEVGQGAGKYGQSYDYKNDTLYEKADYGYEAGGSVTKEQYQQFYRQGFKRGYDDGFNNRSKYGTKSKSGDTATILDSVVETIVGKS